MHLTREPSGMTQCLNFLQSSKTHVACVWDRNFPMKITAQISDEYSLYDITNIRLRFSAAFHSPIDQYRLHLRVVASAMLECSIGKRNYFWNASKRYGIEFA